MNAITRLKKVAEYCNMTRFMVSSSILSYGRPVEVLKNYTIGSGIEVNPEIQKFDIDRQTCIMG